ncbi:MAG: SpoIIE family protein phosphatase [Chloroflexaceae bacterium]|nr:SpoIIE family protein phosphatase [Chloroflexaceae bacterium]
MAHILVIDDDPAIQVLLKRTLTRQGYQVSVASDGREGLEKALHLRPALILCDWLMPYLDGIEVCHRIKSAPELATTFFILLTSLSSIEDRVKGLDAGADDFLCKPVELYELKARVRAGLRLHQLSRDLQEQKRRLEAELVEAAEYVSSILPEPLKVPSVEIEARFIPSRQLGGDSFDYYWLDGEHLAIYLLDVSGHGLRAALPSLSVLNLLRSQGLNRVNFYQPCQVLQGLNRTFPMTLRNDKYFTIWYGIYNIKRRQLVFASAGHPPAILMAPNRQGSLDIERMKTPGFPIGMFLDAQYRNASCRVAPGSSLYIFSDGIYEFDGRDGSIWGLDAFIELLQTHRQSGKQSLDRLIEQVSHCNAKTYFDDDISLMQIHFE